MLRAEDTVRAKRALYCFVHDGGRNESDDKCNEKGTSSLRAVIVGMVSGWT